MTSNESTAEEQNLRKDSVVKLCDEVLAELNDMISHLTLSTRDDPEPVPNPTTESLETRSYTSEFEEFSAKDGVNQPYTDYRTPFRRFLHEKALEPRSKDPEDYPGIQHAATLFLRDSEAEDGNNFDRLNEEVQDTLKDILNSRFATAIAQDRFVTGQLIGHGMTGSEWLITSELFGVSGSFNRGIFQVEDNTEPDYLDDYGTGNFVEKRIAIMKALPSPALDPGFACREISILRNLNHDNIIAFRDGRVPRERHETGWMVTEFCNKGTLKNLVEKYAEAGASIPELYVWNILESLVRALVYLHYGPNLLKKFDRQKPGDGALEPTKDSSWDPVYHRDIILANVFCNSNPWDVSEYPQVKLGDFGCAMKQSEVDTKDNKKYPWSNETPPMDEDYEPPEGQYATKAVDVYQVGLLVWCIVRNDTSPSRSLIIETLQPEDVETSSSSRYSRELLRLLRRCVKKEPNDRIDSLLLLHLIRHDKNVLLSENRLPWVELLA